MYILFSYKLLWSGGPSSPPASLIIKVLTQEEVGSQVLIFFTREVGLDHQALGEAQCLQPFYSFLLLRCHLDIVHLWGLLTNGTNLPLYIRDVRQLPGGLIQHLDELLLVAANLLQELRVFLAQLLEQSGQQRRVLLNHLPHVLELRLIPQELQGVLPCCFCGWLFRCLAFLDRTMFRLRASWNSLSGVPLFSSFKQTHFPSPK